MESLILQIANSKQINKNEALKFFDLEIEDLCLAASKIRKQYKGNKITDVKIYPLLDAEKK
ncbi:MAG: hypothetical protein LBD17_02790 [Endomicrobium sp.]|jgi:biotin synthase-like enzyme|nr:hypothetical protein [Endomicrobium sp.]